LFSGAAGVTPAVCIIGWNDADLLAGCLDSVEPLGWHVYYVDGRFALYPDEPRENRLTLAEAIGHRPVTIINSETRWPHEAGKRDIGLSTAIYAADDWLLYLDTDERLECPDPARLEAMLDAQTRIDCYVGLINIYRPDFTHHLEGFNLPRFIRCRPGMTFHPPRDFDVYCDGLLMASPAVDPIDWKSQVFTMPVETARIRHERRLRSRERAEQNTRYQQARMMDHGV